MWKTHGDWWWLSVDRTFIELILDTDVTVQSTPVTECIRSLPKGKACGPDGIKHEHIPYECCVIVNIYIHSNFSVEENERLFCVLRWALGPPRKRYIYCQSIVWMAVAWRGEIIYVTSCRNLEEHVFAHAVICTLGSAHNIFFWKNNKRICYILSNNCEKQLTTFFVCKRSVYFLKWQHHHIRFNLIQDILRTASGAGRRETGDHVAVVENSWLRM